ncbi:MAG: hypothetical protein ACK5O5_00095, partial [bacterium]
SFDTSTKERTERRRSFFCDHGLRWQFLSGQRDRPTSDCWRFLVCFLHGRLSLEGLSSGK